MNRPVISRPSPNHSARPPGTVVSLLVLHADAGRTDEGTLNWITAKRSGVSYHWLVGRDGRIYQCVPDDRRAWHAGASSFEGRTNCNAYSIGVSFANDQAGEPFTLLALEAGADLVAHLCVTHRIPIRRIVTHAAIATPAGRKKDPDNPPGTFDLRAFLADVAERIVQHEETP